MESAPTHQEDKMKTQFAIVFVVTFLILVPFSVLKAETEHDIDEIVSKIDELYRSRTSYSKMEMQIITPHWERTLKMEGWSEDMDKTFILINSPKKEKGVATLRIENEMWNYLPKTDKVMKIPPSMMMGSWMGSDFTNDDLVKESTWLDDYNTEFFEVEEPKEGELYIQMLPKEDSPVVWGRIVCALREEDYLPIWEEYYDEKGNLMRLMEFKDIKDLGGKIIPTVMELTPMTEKKKGNQTIVRYVEADFDVKLDKDVFTMRNLRKKR
jgi:outer membrane lipoprotein-sorting protein